MTTPYELAQDVLATVVEIMDTAAPTVQFAQVGPQVVDCESVITAATTLEESPLPGCDCGRITLVTTIARDCAMTANDDGTNNPEAIAAVSALIDNDAIALRSVGQVYVLGEWSVGWSLDGGLGITSLTITMPMPCG